MHFPRYWTTANQKGVMAWGWSDESLAQARGKAAERLTKILACLSRGGRKPAMRYGYDRPMREEVLREFRGSDGTLRAAVTRNSYGCLVLNTADFMFVDVDAPEARESSFLAGLFGFRKPDKNRAKTDFTEAVTGRVQDWLAKRPNWGWRVYRTCAGIRLLATQQPISSDDATCKEAFEAFGADPLYRRLCLSQRCFRARLTPKPWRCAVEKPRGRWPWADTKTEDRFRKWEAAYVDAAKHYAICSLIGQFGNAEIAPGFGDLVKFHDEITRVDASLPLA